MTAPVSPAATRSVASPWLMIAVAVPPAVAAVLVLLFIAMELAGRTPSAIEPQNIAESAGLGNGAEILRRLQLGEDPTRVQTIRPEIISSQVTRVTALEAAVLSRKVQLVELLDDRGAIVGAEARQSLACLAQDAGVGDIVEYLAPAGAPPCEPGATRARLMARSGESE